MPSLLDDGSASSDQVVSRLKRSPAMILHSNGAQAAASAAAELAMLKSISMLVDAPIKSSSAATLASGVTKNPFEMDQSRSSVENVDKMPPGSKRVTFY